MHTNLHRTLGILGMLAGCGPSAPQDPNTGTTGADDDSTGVGPGTDSSSSPTSSESTDPTTTTPPPECDDYDDCSDLYCGYCDVDGVCREGVGCCGDYAGGGVLHPRCTYVECYSDSDCGRGEICDEFNTCIPVGPMLPPCDDIAVVVSQWGLSATPGAFVLADLDADGDLDLAAAQPSVAQIEIALNDGAGNFVLAGFFGVGAPTTSLSLAAGDLDDDGDNDLAVVRGDPDGGLILLFGQDAVFVPQPVLPTVPSPTAVHIAEVNDDTLEDVVVVGPDNVHIRLGDQPATFANEMTALIDPIDPRGVLFDFSGDGRLDLISAIPGGTAVGVWHGDGGGKFIPDFSLDSMIPHDAVLAADINLTDLPPADDLPHLVFAQTVPDGGEIEVWAEIDAPQMFNEPTKFLTLSPISGGVFAELGEPGGPDILAATGSPEVLVVLGDGAGGFACERTLKVEVPTTQSLLAAGDLDNAGSADIVVGDQKSPIVTVLLSQ